jgi:hypothetical protein
MQYAYAYQLNGTQAGGFDPDANAYILAVEAADGQALEAGVKKAYNTFVKGCKSDGIWDAIKASCIMAGARTLSGALVPLKGTAPTNFNFVSGDYTRQTGLVGNNSTKYLNSSRTGNADPQNNAHIAVWISTITSGAGVAAPYYIGSGGLVTGAKGLLRRAQTLSLTTHGVLPTSTTLASQGPNPPLAGLFAYSRTGATAFTFSDSGAIYSDTTASQTPTSDDTFVFARNNASGVAERYSNGCLAFYSIGEALNLSQLNSRVSTLITDIAAAIP